jgi:hypothetical protein
MANRPDEDEMVLLIYGEHPDADRLRRAIADDPEAARRWEALRHELAALDELAAPEPRPGLETRLWTRLAPELERTSAARRAPFFGWRAWTVLAAASLTLGVAGFLAGRLSRPAPVADAAAVSSAPGAPPEAARARVLSAALVAHLDASERLLVEVSNRAPALADERRWAEALLGSNRLYRRAAERSGQRRISALLAELEPLLAELANAPAGRADLELDSARERIENQDLLFKVRVTRSNI